MNHRQQHRAPVPPQHVPRFYSPPNHQQIRHHQIQHHPHHHHQYQPQQRMPQQQQQPQHQHMRTPQQQQQQQQQPQQQQHQRHSIQRITAQSIPNFNINLSQLPQIPVVIPQQRNPNSILAPTLGATPIQTQHNLHVQMSTNRPILTQSRTNNAFTHNALPTDFNTAQLPSNFNLVQTLPNISYREPPAAKPQSPIKAMQASLVIQAQTQPRTPMQAANKQQHRQLMQSPSKSSTQSHLSSHAHTISPSNKSRKRSISEMKDANAPNNNELECASKRRKLSAERKITRSTATNRVWRQTRQNAKFRMAIELLDGFRADHGGKLPSLRAIMKMLKVGFPKAHEILDEYAKHVGCSKDKLVEDMTIRQEKKNKNDIDGNRKKRMNRNIFEYPINVNGKLQEIILNLLHQQKVGNVSGCNEMYNKMEKSVIEFEGFYNKFGLNDKLRLAQSYFMLSSWCLYEQKDYEQSYEFMEKALSTFRDCNYLAMAAGHTVATVDSNAANAVANTNHHVCPEDVGFFWPQIFEIYILGGHILLENKQYYDAKLLYLFAYELVKYVMNAPPLCFCVALENLSHVCKLENNINGSIDYIEEIIKILSTDNDACTNTNNSIDVDDDGSADDNECDRDHSIKLLNVRAYYSALLSLHCFENGDKFTTNEIGYNMNKAMQIYNDVIKECVVKFGEEHQVTFGVYLYFALHFVNIEKFDFAFDHIEYIMNHSFLDKQQHNRKLSKEEKVLLQYVLNGFMDKLLSFSHNNEVLLFNNGDLKENVLQIFEYQLLCADDINHYVNNIQQQQTQNDPQEDENKKSLVIKEEKSDGITIKKEKDAQYKNNRNTLYNFYNKKKETLTFIDKNDLILNQQMRVLLNKFKDYDRVQQFVRNFEENQMRLNPAQRETLERIKAEMKAMKDNNVAHNSHSQMAQMAAPPYDFNVLPNFLPVTAPSM